MLIERRKKNYKAKKILVYGISPDDYNRISIYLTAKDIWDCLQKSHEGTTQVKQSKVDMLKNKYETFTMQQGESIQETYTRFIVVTNEIHCKDEVIPAHKWVRKILSILLKIWERKVDAISKARDLNRKATY